MSTSARSRDRRRPADGRPGSQPDPRRLATVVAKLFLEVEQGRRPLPQLEPLMCPELYGRLRRTVTPQHPTRGPRHGTVAVLSAHVYPAEDDAYDAAIVVRRGGRAGSLALRIQRQSGAWRVVELGRPEDHGATYRRPAITALR